MTSIAHHPPVRLSDLGIPARQRHSGAEQDRTGPNGILQSNPKKPEKTRNSWITFFRLLLNIVPVSAAEKISLENLNVQNLRNIRPP
ncbi:MAG: hypothetical protein OXN87_02550 [Chloroflexota bacterium]|nr:hypothetical protein [Chloroflexota bacterium]